jgi:hypothetical protein
MPEQFAGGPRGFHRRVEVMRHEGKVARPSSAGEIKKPGGENEFSSRVEVIGLELRKAP